MPRESFGEMHQRIIKLLEECQNILEKCRDEASLLGVPKEQMKYDAMRMGLECFRRLLGG